MLNIRVNQLETIILNLVSKKDLTEKQKKVIEKILQKRGVVNSNKGN